MSFVVFLLVGIILSLLSIGALIIAGVSDNEKLGICSFTTLVCGVYLVITSGCPILLN